MRGDYDAIVVGGGPAGATAGILLAQAGWRVCIVEKAAFPRRKVCGEYISATTWPLLQALGVAGPLLAIAGPPVRRVGVYAGAAMVTAELGASGERDVRGGCAVGREALDTALLARAAAVGATILQPSALAEFAADAGGYECRIVEKGTRRCSVLRSTLVVAAHGSWESGAMPTQDLRRAPRPADLFGFKARFRDGALPAGLMPLLAFPGGYGGMVHTDGGDVSLSCCIRRDQLERCRQHWPQGKAGATVLAHVRLSCRGVALALAGAAQDGDWLSTGPLRPGIRSFGHDGIFAIGNAAAEAHPVIAEGISMAIQSAALLCEQLLARPGVRCGDAAQRARDAARRAYEAAWRRNFARRLQFAAVCAQLFMRPASARPAARLLAHFPQLLTAGARWSGKASTMRGAQMFSGTGG